MGRAHENERAKAYTYKAVAAEEALKAVKSGDTVVFHASANEPKALVDALVGRAPELRDVTIIHMTSLGEGKYTLPEFEKNFRHNGLFISAPTRAAVNGGRADYTPTSYSEVPKLFEEGIIPINIFLMQVPPPDKHGYCSFGLTVDYAKAAAKAADIVIAQINRCMPHTGGEKIHVDTFNYIVEKDEPISELTPPNVGDVEREIAKNVASLIPDGATLQLGIGAIPDTVLSFLDDKKDLGIHSEMFSDGVVDLAEAGVITNKKKAIRQGKFVATFLMGTQKLYSFVDHNPEVEMLSVDFVNDPYIIGRNENLISINSALQVDLTGQVNAETLGTKHFTGIGGQLDFVRGANRSKGGKSIIALPSTAAGGKMSRICNDFGPGAAVTTPRGDVQYIVTEYGIANLKGKCLSQRIHELINIAHPKFQKELLAEAKKLGRFLERHEFGM
ncbi:MAG: 4-hydroxybutyrate CoA-transferase [Clostridiales Family XIII bacterium]|jgi:4-hydroxybutyrate CoA-transferase|nr:4-hydroxybutyrate CoA-transferase [Clostridiales Family XIII bacterium]